MTDAFKSKVEISTKEGFKDRRAAMMCATVVDN